jgi:hypothetical protein
MKAVLDMKVNGKIIKGMEKVYFMIGMVINSTKVSVKMIKRAVMEHLIWGALKSILGIGNLTKNMVME